MEIFIVVLLLVLIYTVHDLGRTLTEIALRLRAMHENQSSPYPVQAYLEDIKTRLSDIRENTDYRSHMKEEEEYQQILHRARSRI
jgi:hypothetical protein